MKELVLKSFLQLKNKQGTIFDIAKNRLIQEQFKGKKLTSALAATIGHLQKENLVTCLEYNRTKGKPSVYTISTQGELSLLFKDNSLTPTEFRFPYVLLDPSILSALKRWESLQWEVPVYSTSLIDINEDPLPLCHLLKYLFSKDLINIELQNDINLRITILAIDNICIEFFSRTISYLSIMNNLLTTLDYLTNLKKEKERR